MAPAPTARRPSRNESFQHVFAQKNTKRGLKRRASREAMNPRVLKRARRDEPPALSLTRRPRQSQIVSVSTQKRSSRDSSLMFFVWGCGDDGSLGLGPDHLEEISRPRRVDRQGITSIAAGGLYTLLLDRNGKASSSLTFLPSFGLSSKLHA